MKYKSKTNSFFRSNNIKHTITSFNLKIKNINILLDDITTNKTSKNIPKIKRSNSLQNNNDFHKKFSTLTYNNSNNFIYNRKRLNSKNGKEDKDKSLKSIPISFKKSESYKNTESSPSSFLTTMEGFYSNNLTGLISERSNINKKICLNRISHNDYNDICCKFDDIIEKNKIYIKKSNNIKFRYNNRSSFNKKDVIPIIFRSKIINNKEKKKNFIYQSKTVKLKPNQGALTTKPKIEKKKIKLNVKRNNKKETNNNYYFNIKFIILIQKWWKNMKMTSIIKKNTIIIQKAFRSFLKRKNIIINNRAIINKIPKNNNFYIKYYITKVYYTNNITKIILIQKYFKKYLTKIKFYKLLQISINPISYHINIQKPEIKPCYITKEIDFASHSNIKTITFAKKKLNSFSKKKRNLKYKSLINNYNSFSYNFTTKDYKLKSDENSFQTINNSESHDFNNNDIINKVTYEITKQNDIKNIQYNNEIKMKLSELFIRNIFLQLNSILFKVGYTYKSLLNLINSVDLIFIKYKLDLFLNNLSFFNTRKINFIRNICRHINIYKKSNYIKNEIIELIEKNISKEINYENFDYRWLRFTSEQKNNLINSQVFKEDNNLINYIYLFFKYEKNKKVNINFIENRLIKEPLNYRNIFTILRYIDNLDEKINNNKICTNCFCKKNERVCSLKCKCHFLANVINLKSQDFNKKKAFKTYRVNEENIENNPNVINAENKNNIDYIKSKGNINGNIDFQNYNVIKGMRINKTFHYFNG